MTQTACHGCPFKVIVSPMIDVRPPNRVCLNFNAPAVSWPRHQRAPPVSGLASTFRPSP
jgi:hypothetical protein